MLKYEYSPMLKNAVLRYQEYLKSCDRWRESSEESLHYFDKFCKKRFDTSRCVTQQMVDAWFTKFETEKINSCIARVCPVRALLIYMNAQKMTNIEIPALPKFTKDYVNHHYYTEEELVAFFTACDNMTEVKTNTVSGKNLRITIPVFFRFLYSSGIRIYEARMLKREEVDLVSGIVTVGTAKGGIQHYFVLHDSMLSIMNAYNTAIEKLYPEREYFFPGTGKTPYLTKCCIQHQYQKIWSRVGKGHSVLYDFRHNYAIENINNWDNDVESFSKLVYLSKSMGHTNLKSTMYYYHYTSHLASILAEKTEENFNKMLPEVDFEDFTS